MRACSRLTDGWRFCAAPDPFGIPLHKSAYYAGAKTESHLRGFASLSYVETSENCRETWTPVTVPHDYVIRQMPSPDHPGTLGSQDYPEGWYRRNFHFTEEDRGRRIVLCFEAVATDCAVFFNGCPIVENHTAYTPFEADITDPVPPHSRTRVMYAGAAAVAVQTADSPFPTAVTVRGDRLGYAMLTL